VRVPRDTVLDLALREIELSRDDWQRDLAPEMPGPERRARSQERALASLEHVFTVLSLGLEREPLLLAYRALASAEQGIRGTALEYLETVLPPAIREAIWPYLGGAQEPRSLTRSLDEAREDLLRSTESLVVDLGRMARIRPDGAHN
jgi:hypothetical protein